MLTVDSLKGKKKIAEVFRRGRRFFSPAAAIIVEYNEAQSQHQFLKTMIVVRKKTAHKSVVRNRIRRLVRECLRQFLKEKNRSGYKISFSSIVVFWNIAPAHPALLRLEAVNAILQPLLERACAYKEKTS